jgi:hypothetical protein
LCFTPEIDKSSFDLDPPATKRSRYRVRQIEHADNAPAWHAKEPELWHQ